MTVPANGLPEIAPDPPLRIVWFGQSVISDWNNPVATTVRATIRALQAAGHSVTFLEPRNSAPFVEALSARGWAPYRDFQQHFADLHYRTYDMPRRAERDVWLSREAALVDAVIVQSDVPPEIFQWLSRVPDSPMVRVLLALESTVDVPDVFDLVLSPAEVGLGEPFEPAVLPLREIGSPERSGTIVALYSDIDLGLISEQMTADPIEIVATGAGASKALPYLSEAAIVEGYRRVKKAVVIDADPSPFAAARTMLAVAQGVDTWALAPNGSIVPAPSYVDATEQTARLVFLIRDAQKRIAEVRSGHSSNHS